MKCSYCNIDYPSEYYFIYSDDSDQCIDCFKSSDHSCEFYQRGLRDLAKINSSTLWLKRLSEMQIIHDKSIMRFIRVCINYLQPLTQSPEMIEKMSISIEDWLITFKFKLEFIWIPVLFITSFFLIIINIEIYLSISLFVILIITILAFYDVFHTGKECRLNLNYGYIEILMPKFFSYYSNKLPQKFYNFRDQKIFFKDVEDIILTQKSSRARGEYTVVAIKLKSNKEIILGLTINHEFAEEIKNVLYKIFNNKIDLKNGLLKCT